MIFSALKGQKIRNTRTNIINYQNFFNMKKIMNKNLAYAAAMLLAGTMSFSSCSSDEEIPVNPTFDGKSVKTQFAINIPRAAQAKTRMTEGNTQGNGAGFLGMQDIRLIPLTEEAGATTTFDQMITLSNIAGITAESSSKIYKDVAIPTGTNHFLFYGQALRTGATDVKNGSLTATIDGARSTADITFALKDVNTGNVENANSDALLEVMNAVAHAKVDDDNTWKGTEDANLKKLYDRYVKSQAGSANSVLCTMQSLYDALKDNTDALAVKIKEAITENGTFTLADNRLSTANTYPADLNLPDGAVGVKFNGERDEFQYVTPGAIESTENPVVDATKITYPASLYYWTSTSLFANDVAVEQWPNTPADWEATGAFADWYSEVKSSTQSVALKNNIDYGVGNLALTVTCTKQVLQDKETVGEDGIVYQRNVTVPADGFPVSAVLVANQPSSVGYDFTSVAGATFDKVIYDRDCQLAAKYNVTSATNYTLVLPSKGMEKPVVKFVLELTNNSGTEFVGQNNQIIPNGGKFYLAGALNVNAENGVTNPAALEDVFISDYLTKANVKISSLKDAYNVIPDLRATNLQLGLSVDLEWEEGITFEVEIK